MIRDGYNEKGPPLITFAGILKYDVFPLASILIDILKTGEKGMGCPVEIEFAVNFDRKNKKPPAFVILQIRPMVISREYSEIDWDDKDINMGNVLIRSNKALGHEIIDSVQNIVYVPPKSFDSSKTIEIAEQIKKINKNLTSEPYLLIGPGRWGTQDRWLGMPVSWSGISNVKVMVETALKEFNIKPTQGTHFFQNIISKGIGYINTTLNPQESFIDWELQFVKHIRLSSPLTIKLDGRRGRALILKPKN
jgi:hypothetical protein